MQRAPKYDANNGHHRFLANETLKQAALQPGMRVLDVATGTGLVALEASRQVYAGDHCGHVLGVDVSEDMLAKVKQQQQAIVEASANN